MIAKQVKLFIVLTLVACANFQKCGIIASDELVKIGSYLLYEGQSENRQHTYSIAYSSLDRNNQLLKVFEAVASVKQIDDFNPTTQLDFTVRTLINKEEGRVIVDTFINHDNSWNRIRVNILVSLSSEIITGTTNTLQTIDSFKQFNKEFTVTENYLPTQRLNPEIPYQVRAFVTGIKGPANTVLNIFNEIYDKNDRRVLIQFVSQTAIKMIQFSYVIYPYREIESISELNALENRADEFVGIRKINRNNITFSSIEICLI